MLLVLHAVLGSTSKSSNTHNKTDQQLRQLCGRVVMLEYPEVVYPSLKWGDICAGLTGEVVGLEKSIRLTSALRIRALPGVVCMGNSHSLRGC